MAIPVNFPFTYTIYSYENLPFVTNFFVSKIGGSQFVILDILFGIWGIGVAIHLIVSTIKYFKSMNFYSSFIIEKTDNYSKLYNILEEYYSKPLRISVVPTMESPAIIGIRYPILILPDIDFTEEELRYICIHEIGHLKQHHLWLTLLFEIVCCVHWWNPIVTLAKKEYALFLELSNDSFLVKTQSDTNILNYAQFILRISKILTLNKKSPIQKSLCFISNQNSVIDIRMSFLVNGNQSLTTNDYRKFILHSFIVLFSVLISLFIVPEASSYIDDAEMPGSFELTAENAYLIETDNGYDLYLNEELVYTFDFLPDNLNYLPVYTKGDLLDEK